MKNQLRLKSNQGFTLLEVLIAIGITAMIGLGSWQILASALKTNESTQERLKELNSLQRTMLILSRDIKQIISRSTRNEYGDYGHAIDTNTDFYLLEFTRTGWRNPLGDKRSDLQRVAYQLEEGKLVRYHWYVLDRAQDSEPYNRTLMRSVEGLNLKFMTEKGSWVSSWPQDETDNSNEGDELDPREKNSNLPRAVKLELESARFGKITRLFEIPGYLSGKAFKAEENDSSSNNPDNNSSSGSSSTSNSATGGNSGSPDNS